MAQWRGHTRNVTVIGVLAVLVMAVVPGLLAGPAAARPVQRQCAVPAADGRSETARPEQVSIDSTRLATAVRFAASRMRTNIQVYRNNCLIGTGPLNGVSGNVPWNLFSSTKSVVSILAGIAYTQHRLRLDDSIADYLPRGLVDRDHAEITVRDLLQQTSGLREAIASEGLTAIADVDSDVVRQALATPVEHRPGTYFEYTQRAPDLLAAVVQHAVGEDLQTFAQRNLFDPLGIRREDYHWARDRSGNTYGFAFLFLPPNDFARLGLLMVNGGRWGERQILSPEYVRMATTPSRTNPCYAFLFWVNHSPCTGPTFPSRQLSVPAGRQLIAGMPSDAYAMVGFLQQNNFVVPSLGLLVTWTGVLGDVSADPGTVLSANPNSELYHDFFRLLAAAFVHPKLPDPGPYVPSVNLDLDLGRVIDPNVMAGAVGLGPYAPPGCTAISCGPVPLRLPLQGNPGCFALTCVPGLPQSPGRRGD